MTNNSQLISLVMASDDRGAMPLTVAAYSAIKNLRDRQANLFILDGGIKATSKRKICESITSDRLNIHWIQPVSPPFLEEICRKGDYRRFPLPSYYRLLLPQILPQDIEKVIYLDIDVIVLHDLAKLWSIDIGNYHFLAVQEPDGPYVIDCFQRYNPQLKYIDFERLGVTREHKYCNSGVMVINVEKWRQDKIMEKAFSFLESYPVRYADQDALNVVLAGKWGTLDPRWNQTTAFLHKQENNPYSAEVIDRVVRDPFIIHFTWTKPWGGALLRGSDSRTDLFWEYCNQTAWAWSIRRKYWLHRFDDIVRRLKRFLMRLLKGILF